MTAAAPHHLGLEGAAVIRTRPFVLTERAISELLAFPNGNHDDFVDALAYIGLTLAPKTAALIADLIHGRPPGPELTPALPSRF